ncbi:MAG: tetratricopeptide repeat protein [Prevotella sp.]|nr:tetratricopeptide repeat protein [Prevotella sp.]
MDIAKLIRHPELLDRETLYDLRSLLALYPYHQTARLLLLQNLYLLHNPTFDEELRRAAVYITDRKVIFNLVEAAHYQLKSNKTESSANNASQQSQTNDNRTISLIDHFLDTIPEEEEDTPPKRTPTPADASVDYVSYLLEIESEEEKSKGNQTPLLKGQDLIDNFINNGTGKIQLKEEPEFTPDLEEKTQETEKEEEEGYFTETLAKIYIKQGRYAKALEIIQRLNLNYPKKNAYFADQIRFLEKLILNNKNNK